MKPSETGARTSVRVVKCPHCGAEVPWTPDSRYRPFCSARCRQIDLGAWASDSYRIPGSEPDPGEGEDGGTPS